MATNYNLLKTGLKQTAIVLLLFIVSPILLTMAFKAIKIYTSGWQIYVSYAFLVVSAGLMIFAVLLAFKTIRTYLSAFFDD